MTVDTWIQAGLALVGTAGGVVSARAARRTKRQEKRDDFTTIKDALNERIDDLKKDITSHQTQITCQQDQITGQGAAISWLVVDRRSLVGYIRGAGLEPPVARPIPERARPFLDSIDV
ncbi:hypothetical protein AQI95_24550 [Streptomyces yokosukanensis]|uniref:Uncharacterized protein n=1 Tax=Streptomyces yokosukanensis TaxID=67386 RepID=A0A117Q1D5_9ACTN|nr:hypothetical protein [Streptomyces yokosukanensis]KUN03133.1 hypothetical protein AQI95_24550 [Streptomyces yokosukanensis]